MIYNSTSPVDLTAEEIPVSQETSDLLGLQVGASVDEALQVQHQSSDTPVGYIQDSVLTDMGDDWLLCNGEYVDIQEYPALKNVLKYSWDILNKYGYIAYPVPSSSDITSNNFIIDRDMVLWTTYRSDESRLRYFKIGNNDDTATIALSTHCVSILPETYGYYIFCTDDICRLSESGELVNIGKYPSTSQGTRLVITIDGSTYLVYRLYSGDAPTIYSIEYDQDGVSKQELVYTIIPPAAISLYNVNLISAIDNNILFRQNNYLIVLSINNGQISQHNVDISQLTQQENIQIERITKSKGGIYYFQGLLVRSPSNDRYTFSAGSDLLNISDFTSIYVNWQGSNRRIYTFCELLNKVILFLDSPKVILEADGSIENLSNVRLISEDFEDFECQYVVGNTGDISEDCVFFGSDTSGSSGIYDLCFGYKLPEYSASDEFYTYIKAK